MPNPLVMFSFASLLVVFGAQFFNGFLLMPRKECFDRGCFVEVLQHNIFCFVTYSEDIIP